MTPFSAIRARAEKRKGKAELAKLLLEVPPRAALAKLGDDRALAQMAQRIFSAGFAWSVIEAKWPGFEAAFHGFDPAKLAFEPDDYWDALAKDTRIVRNPIKIAAVRKNATFVREIAKEHGSFGKFLAAWPPDDEVGLLALLAKRGSHLGGNTGQMLLRFLGFDAFVLSRDVVSALRDAGVDIAPEPKSKGDMAKIQVAFNAWAKQSGLPYAHLSRICAMSIGENRTPDYLAGDDA
jgi:3-methyladenine DNA glycosylase Tag